MRLNPASRRRSDWRRIAHPGPHLNGLRRRLRTQQASNGGLGFGLFGVLLQRLLQRLQRQPQRRSRELHPRIGLTGAAFAGAGVITIAERKVAQASAPVFVYMMTDHINATIPGTNYQVGAMHAMDIRLKFDNIASTEARQPSLTAEERAEHDMAAKNMSRLWANFARTSQPSATGQPPWPAYDLKTRATMMIAARCHVANDPYPAEREVWSTIG
jgi:carboxylesterase type B